MKNSIFNAKYSIKIKSTKYSDIINFIEDYNLLELTEPDFIRILDYYNEI